MARIITVIGFLVLGTIAANQAVDSLTRAHAVHAERMQGAIGQHVRGM